MFTKQIKTALVPATTIEEEAFTCNDCGKDFSSEEDASRHVGRTHAVAAMRKSDETSFNAMRTSYLVLDKNKFEAWMGSYRSSYRDIYTKGWKGPGWYQLFVDTRRCSGGCCDEETLEARSVRDEIGSALYRIEEEKKNIKALEEIDALGLSYRSDVVFQDD